MTGTFNSDLVDDLARQKVILFLGAGVSASATTRSGTRMKGWGGISYRHCGRAAAAEEETGPEINKGQGFSSCE